MSISADVNQMSAEGQAVCVALLQANARSINRTLATTTDPLARRNLRLNLDATERRLFDLLGYYGDYTTGGG